MSHLSERKKAQVPTVGVYHMQAEDRPIFKEDLLQMLRRKASERLADDRFTPPRLPRAAMEVMQLAGDPRVSAAQMAKVIERDAFLAGRLLARSNSASLQPTAGKLTSIPLAITRLGMGGVRDIVVAESLKQTIFRGRHKQLMEEYWRFGISAAVACREVARAARLSPDGAFLVGLLYDVGRPVLLWLLEDVLRELEGRLEAREALEALSSDLSASVGALLLSRWRLPGGLVEIVREACNDAAPTQRSRSQAVLVMGRWMAQQYAAGADWTDLAQRAEDIPVPTPLEIPVAARRLLATTYVRELEALLT